MKNIKFYVTFGLMSLALITIPNAVNAANTTYLQTSKYKISESKILTNLEENNLSVSTILSNVSVKGENLKLEAYSNTGKKISGNTLMGTNSSIKVLDKTGNTLETVKLVVYGDTTGDGRINSSDALAIIKNKLGKKKFENEYFIEAGRVSDATRKKQAIPSSSDALAIIKNKLGKIKINQYYTNEKEEITQNKLNALEKAKSYLNLFTFSYEGLVEQLEFDGFTSEEAEYGAKNCGANWKEQALKCAKQYLKISAFSYEGLVEQLEFDGFTSEEAEYGAKNCGANWKEQALKCAKQYLKISAFSYEGLIDQLEYDGFTSEEAEYGAKNCGANWTEQAVKCAKQYLKYSDFSYEGLKRQLEYEGFSSEEAEYGVKNCGVNW